jgi:hypothetical protein
MTDPITLAIATKAAESLGAQVGPALGAIVRKVKERFTGRPELGPGHERELTSVITQAMDEDPAFAADLKSLWQQHIEVADGVVNTFHGTAENVVQLRDVQGDLNIN